MDSKKVTIVVPDRVKCFESIRNLYFKAGILKSTGCLIFVVVLAVIWHGIWKEPDQSMLFFMIGLVIFCLLVTAIHSFVMPFIEIKSLSKKDDDFIRYMYIELVKTGDIKPIPATN